MYAMATFLIVALLSMLFTRLVTGALVATGMPPEIASFQARSAFTGAGFTTTEAENVVNHPTRRRVISLTMFVGNLGVPTLVVTVLFGLLAPGPGETSTRLTVLLAGVGVIVVLSFTPPVTRLFVEIGRLSTRPLIKRALTGTAVELYAFDDDVSAWGLPLGEDVPLRSVRGVQQSLPRVRVIGVRRHGRPDEFVFGPPTDVELASGDELVVVGDHKDIARLLDSSWTDGQRDDAEEVAE